MQEKELLELLEIITLRELLELTLEKSYKELAKSLSISEHTLRVILVKSGCKSNGRGKRGWKYEGEDSTILEQSIEELSFIVNRASMKSKINSNEIETSNIYSAELIASLYKKGAKSMGSYFDLNI